MVVLPSITSVVAKKGSWEEIMVETPSQDTLEKIIGAPIMKRHKKATYSASVSLEAHQPPSFLTM
jgi:hypothetical protein